MMRRHLLWALVLAAACGEGGNTAKFTARDSAGVRIVEHATLEGLPVRTFAADTPDVRLGSAMGDPSEVLDRVSAGVVQPDGRIIVLNSGMGQIRVYDRSGGLAATEGGQGEGPGEYVFPSGLFVTRADTLVVWDAALGRASVLTPDAQYVRDLVPGGNLASPRLAGAFGNGELLFVDPSLELKPGSSIQTQSGRDLRASPDGEIQDTLGAYPGRTAQLIKDGQPATNIGPRDMVTIRAVPFAAETQRAVAANGYWVATTKERAIEFHDTTGALVTIARWPGAPLEVTDPDKEAYVNERIAQASTDEERTALRGAGVGGFEFAPTLPAHGPLLVDALGDVWVSDFVKPETFDPVRWTVFGPDGVAKAQVELPSYATLLWADKDRVLLKIADELGIEYVELWRLTPLP
jgi:hypothetical protein